jgi:proteasome accessory factor B
MMRRVPPDDPIDPLERLLNLVGLLLETTRPLTFDEIAERMEGYSGENRDSAKRKFERDKDTLREYGVPIELVDTDVWATEQGYRIRKDAYYLPEISFTPEEITALFVAAQSGTDARGASAGVRKLLYGAQGGVLTGLGGGPLVAASDASGERIDAAAAAAEGRRRVRFGYRNARGEVRERAVDAYGVAFRGGHWYLVGRDRDRDEIRAFRLSRCTTEPVDAGEGSAPPDGFEPREHVRGGPWAGSAADTAVVAFAPGAAALARASFAGAVVEGPEDAFGSDRIVLRIPVADESTTAELLLEYGPEAEVQEPPSLRDLVRDRLEALAGV